MPLRISIPVQNTMELIEGTRISPLISKCYVKVCYVGQEANRNGTVITKEVAAEMGRNLPGSPIVGFFNEQDQDFEGHNRELVVKDGKIDFIETTKPYGFVPTDANIWFEKYKEEDGSEKEYLVADCYIWTKAYPETERIVKKGNNQSMELTNDSGFWANDSKSNKRIFIYSEALIEKLCILGEEVEPCFEGAQIRAFSLDTNSQEFEEFKANMYSMVTELQQIIKQGGSQMTENDNGLLKQQPNSEADFKKKEYAEIPPTNTNGDKETSPADKGAEKDKKKYNLDEIPEYQELLNKYNTITSQFSTLQSEKKILENEVNTLRAYKLKVERKEKQDMIDSFYMLNAEDKTDVIQNIDTYSLNDIEAKLSIACVRKKVNFNADNQMREQAPPTGMFNLNSGDNLPAWITAVQNNQ